MSDRTSLNAFFVFTHSIHAGQTKLIIEKIDRFLGPRYSSDCIEDAVHPCYSKLRNFKNYKDRLQ